MSKTQWPQIAEIIRAKIREGVYQTGDRLASEAEIALEFGVSRPTAHRALAELQRQGLVHRQRRWGTVVTAAPEGMARVGQVAFIVDGFAPSFDFPQAALLAGIQEGLTDDFALTIWDCRGDPRREVDLLEKAHREAKGIILHPTSHEKATPVIRKLVQEGFPLVVIDRIPEGLVCNAVISDNSEVTHRSVSYLIQAGHRRIGFLSFEKPDVTTIDQRLGGYLGALKQAGIESEPTWIRWFPRELEDGRSHLLMQQVQDALFALVKGPAKVSAIFCVQDVFCAYAIQAAAELEITVPGDLDILTFNDWPSMLIQKPWNVHRIVQRKHEIGRKAAELVRVQMDKARVPVTQQMVEADFLPTDLPNRLDSSLR